MNDCILENPWSLWFCTFIVCDIKTNFNKIQQLKSKKSTAFRVKCADLAIQINESVLNKPFQYTKESIYFLHLLMPKYTISSVEAFVSDVVLLTIKSLRLPW